MLEHLGRDLLVELDVVFELAHRRTREGLDLVLIAERLLDALRLGFEVILVRGKLLDFCARRALDQHLHRAVGQLQELQDRSKRAHRVDRGRLGIVVARILLRGEQNLPVGAHHLVERVDRLFAPDE